RRGRTGLSSATPAAPTGGLSTGGRGGGAGVSPGGWVVWGGGTPRGPPGGGRGAGGRAPGGRGGGGPRGGGSPRPAGPPAAPAPPQSSAHAPAAEPVPRAAGVIPRPLTVTALAILWLLFALAYAAGGIGGAVFAGLPGPWAVGVGGGALVLALLSGLMAF